MLARTLNPVVEPPPPKNAATTSSDVTDVVALGEAEAREADAKRAKTTHETNRPIPTTGRAHAQTLKSPTKAAFHLLAPASPTFRYRQSLPAQKTRHRAASHQSCVKVSARNLPGLNRELGEGVSFRRWCLAAKAQWLAALVCWGIFSVLPANAFAIDGSIDGLTIDPSLSYASVADISATYDRCAQEQSTATTCTWEAVAYRIPPAASRCSAAHAHVVLPNEIAVWSATSAEDGTANSGPLRIDLGGINNQHLCVYVNRNSDLSESLFGFTSDLVASQSLYVEPASSESIEVFQPGKGTTLSFAHATRRLRRLLHRRFSSWRQGRARHANCRKRVTPSRIRCPAIRWRRGPVQFIGFAVVQLQPGGSHVNYRIVSRNRRCSRRAHGTPRMKRCRKVHRTRAE